MNIHKKEKFYLSVGCENCIECDADIKKQFLNGKVFKVENKLAVQLER